MATTTHKHTPEITPEEREQVLASAAALAEEFDAIGQRCDAENRFPTEMVPRYREHGLHLIAVPRRYGGRGGDIWTTSMVGRELAKGDPGIALAFNMHQAMVGIFRGTPALEEPMRERIMRAVADEGAILCGLFSEARAGLAGLADTVAVPDPRGGWRLSGRKNWSTLVEGSDLISLNATVTDADGRLPADYQEHAAREATFVFGAGTPGVSIAYTWDTLGMRATGSHTLVMEDAYVGPEAYGGNFRQGLIGEAEWAAILFGGVYLGLAEKAFAEARRSLTGKHLGATATGQDTVISELGYVQHALGRMYSTIEIAARALETTAMTAIEDRAPDVPPAVRKAHWDLAKVVATEAAISVTDEALRLVGGTSFRRGNVLERLFRDARAGFLHSFTTDQLYNAFGRHELGLG
ncbi:MAG TPA: acyl-CoA dehydrogenase family protein [Solirubrobacteraceae bacterium]|jgi:alkylation response protein AidB-like acyl-CoA dehydrogenase|nr:acyl-CoA dehydrogenase family protein [Solirubrobacteraceae bacterium]